MKSTPTLLCPFTKEPVTIVELVGSEGQTFYMARGPFWFTRSFQDRNDLLWHLGFRDGVAPSFPRKVSVKVKEREEPPFYKEEDGS